jgi:predicted DNA-binding protein (UPF0251 family)
MWEMIKIQGEIAIKGITYSDAMNNFAATLNAMWDKLTNGADFTESFNKYAQAGKEVTSEVVDELKNKLKATNEQFDRTWNESGNKISSELKRLIDEATGLETVDFLGVKEFSEKSEEAMKRMTESGAAFRNEMIGANNAVANAAVNAGGINNSADNFQRKVGEAKNDMIVIKNMGDLIAAAKMAQPAQTFAQQVKQAREDLKELSLFLGGDFSKMSIVDIAKRLDIPVARKESKELFAEIQQYIKDANKNPLAFRIDKDATKEDLYEIEKAIADMKAGKEVDLNATPALRKLHMGLENVGGQPVQVKLDAASSINQIRGEMSKQIDLSLSSSTGTSILTAINTAVSAIKACVEKIEPKLPQTALGF